MFGLTTIDMVSIPVTATSLISAVRAQNQLPPAPIQGLIKFLNLIFFPNPAPNEQEVVEILPRDI